METTFDNLPKQIDYLISEVLVIKEILLKRIKKPEEVPKYLTLSKALSFLMEQGYSISKSKLYKLTSSNCIPYHKAGNKLLFCLEELEVWLNNQINKKEVECLYTNLSIVKSAQQKSKTIHL